MKTFCKTDSRKKPKSFAQIIFPKSIKLHANRAGLMRLRQRYLKSKLKRSLNNSNDALNFSCLQSNVCAFTSDNMDEAIRFDTDSCTLILDTGASACFTYCMNDFISFTPLKSKVQGLGTLNIHGVGTVQYPIINDKGHKVMLTIKNAYYVPAIQTRLISPQQICKQSKIRCKFEGDDKSFTLRWERHSKTVAYHNGNNLPVINTAPGMSIGKSIVAQLAQASRSGGNIKCFKAPRAIPRYDFLNNNDEPSEELISTDESNTQKNIKVSCSKTCTDCKTISINEDEKDVLDTASLDNMTKEQREFLTLHERIGHPSFTTMQKWSKLGLLPKKYRKITPPMCLSCHLGKQHKVQRTTDNKIISESIKKPGDLFHMDQAMPSTPGRPMTLSGKNNKEKVTCFTIYVDSVSKRLFAEFQTSTEAPQTIKGKKRVEKFAQLYDVKIKRFRADNGVFRSKEFMEDLDKNNQDITFCAVGAHHQNGVAERHIRTLVERARTLLLHAATRWTDGLATELWTFAVNYALYQWNNTPREDLKFLTPEEVFTGTTIRKLPSLDGSKSNQPIDDISKGFHTFGCPVYVLKEQLQTNKSLPKFDPRSRTGIFVGHSSAHATNVALILNPETGHISSQYHIIFDDKFETIKANTPTTTLDIWDGLYKQKALEGTSDVVTFTPEPFNVSPQVPQTSPYKTRSHASNIFKESNKQKQNKTTNKKSKTKVPLSTDSQSTGMTTPDQGAQQMGATLERERQQSCTLSDSSKEDTDHSEGVGRVPNDPVIDQESQPVDIRTLASKSTRQTRVLRSHDPARPSKATGNRKSSRKRKRPIRLGELEQIRASMHKLAANLARYREPRHNLTFQEQIDRLLDLSSLENGEINDLNPHALAASANPNILSHSQAMKAHDKPKFEGAMTEEVTRMMKNKIFELAPRSEVPRMQRVLRAVWSHRRKTTPEGEIYRHRSRLCVDGSQQQHGIDYSETYSPVVSWTTVRILLMLAKLYGMKMRQVDYVQAFPQAKLPEGEKVYMEIPPGFDIGEKDKSKYCLRLLKNCYGLKQAAYNWNNLLTAGLLKLGFKQSEQDPCLFLKKDIICVLYVDDTIFFSKNDTIIDRTITSLKALDFELTDEGDVESFLGIKIDHNPDGSFHMSQPDLTNRIIETLGLNNTSKQHKTPAVSPPLHEHTNGAPREEKWSYRSVIGMLTYLARNTRPDLEYAVHQCARFQLNPMKAHENAIKRIGRYLLGTRDKGIIFKPDMTSLDSIQCYVDADFAGNYSKETNDNPNHCKSRTGCVIKYAGCPIHWFSRLQGEITLSTTEAEYVALSTAARELLPMRELLTEITQHFNIVPDAPTIHCTLFEDNVGAETLAKAPKMNARTKHIALKYHHFRSAVRKKILRITRVDTKDQQADIFTKPVPLTTLEPLRKEIMGWLTMFKRHGNEDDQNYEIMCNQAMAWHI